ncbi:hypothetical protein GG344DRAFT_67876 [Lentinula edodes]|nr:hypothetical protein GG344DRAFT_67876 [Lentinula edodes]
MSGQLLYITFCASPVCMVLAGVGLVRRFFKNLDLAASSDPVQYTVTRKVESIREELLYSPQQTVAKKNHQRTNFLKLLEHIEPRILHSTQGPPAPEAVTHFALDYTYSKHQPQNKSLRIFAAYYCILNLIVRRGR